MNAKRKKEQDEIDRLRTSKNELQDEYYGKMIEYTKLQYLIHDVKWMNEMKAKLLEKELERQRYIDEKQARLDKIKKEKEERAQREAERKQREEDRRLKEAENKKIMEE